MSDYKQIGYTDWEWIVARAGELYDRQRKSKRGISGQGIFREDGHEYWYAVAAQERIAAALNERAQLMEAREAARSARMMHDDRQQDVVVLAPDKWAVISAAIDAARGKE